MKVLFLDFDGVLNRYGVPCNAPEWARPFPCQWIEKELVQQLAPIFQEHPDCQIVISSTWRILHPLGFLAQALGDVDSSLHKRVYSRTPYLSKTRGLEINAWLAQQLRDVQYYAILDDDADMLPEQKEHFVHVDGTYGITAEDTEQVIHILRKEKKYGSCKSS